VGDRGVTIEELDETACAELLGAHHFGRIAVMVDGTDVAALTASTDGWVAALQLATLSLREGGDAGEGDERAQVHDGVVNGCADGSEHQELDGGGSDQEGDTGGEAEGEFRRGEVDQQSEAERIRKLHRSHQAGSECGDEGDAGCATPSIRNRGEFGGKCAQRRADR